MSEALVLTCSADVAPAITDDTTGCEASHDSAISVSERPRSAPHASSRSSLSKLASLSADWKYDALSREPSGGVCPRRTLPVNTPDASGKNGSTPAPNLAHAAVTSTSIARFSNDHSFCTDTNGS